MKIQTPAHPGEPRPFEDTALKPTPIHFYQDRDEAGRRLAVVYACRVKWEELEKTAHDQLRYCTNCLQPVFHVADQNDFERAVASQRCVMVKPKESRGHFLGFPRVRDYTINSVLNWHECDNS